MQQEYTITLERPSYRAVNFISVILIFLYLLSLGFYLIQTGVQARNKLLLIVPMLIIGLMINGFLKRKQPDFLVYYRTELFICAIGWYYLPLFDEARYFGFLYALVALMERWVKTPDQWVFNTDKITHRVFPRKNYEWVEIEQVMIRDGLFTLDLRNNTLIQKPLDQPVEAALIAEFNQFCQSQLHFNTTSPNSNSENQS